MENSYIQCKLKPQTSQNVEFSNRPTFETISGLDCVK